MILDRIVQHEFIKPLMTTDWGRRLSFGCLAVFACLALEASWSMISSLYSDVTLLNKSKSTYIAQSKRQDTLNLFAEIPKQHLFGQFQRLDKSAAVPITSMQIKLMGISKMVAENGEDRSKAMISEAGQTGKIYGVGDSLPSGIRVYAIHESEVIMENAGHLEKLPLQRTALAFKPREVLHAV